MSETGWGIKFALEFQENLEKRSRPVRIAMPAIPA